MVKPGVKSSSTRFTLTLIWAVPEESFCCDKRLEGAIAPLITTFFIDSSSQELPLDIGSFFILEIFKSKSISASFILSIGIGNKESKGTETSFFPLSLEY